MMNFYTIRFFAYLLAMSTLIDRSASFVVPTGRLPPTFPERTVSSGRSTTRIFESSSVADDEPEVVIEIEDLSMSQIAELIEVTFIQACMVNTVVLMQQYGLW
jgi:hypothetical protein